MEGRDREREREREKEREAVRVEMNEDQGSEYYFDMDYFFYPRQVNLQL